MYAKLTERTKENDVAKSIANNTTPLHVVFRLLFRVNLAITNNPKGGLFRGVAVSTACVIIRRTPATQAQSRQKSSKNPRL